MNKNLYLKVLMIILIMLPLLTHCCPSDRQCNKDSKQSIENRHIPRIHDIDSLKELLRESEQNDNHYNAMLCHKQLGIKLRDKNQFSQAIIHHQKELEVALKLVDTIEIVQAYNNLGTDFRRIASYGEASEYHYKALSYAEAHSEVEIPGRAMKNLVMSLNGIGNICLTLNYMDEAEQYFRRALVDEQKMNSRIGMAINYANIGAIFEELNQLDSATYYYNQSLDQNRMAKSNVGIGLCLMHLGKVHEKRQELDQSSQYYRQSYDLMSEISDRWHWLEACLSLARLSLLQGKDAQFIEYIKRAEKTAIKIQSPDHLSYINKLKHDFYVKHDDYKQALKHYVLHQELRDSIQGVKRNNKFLDMRIGYEQKRTSRMINEIEQRNKVREVKDQRIIYLSWGIVTIIAIGCILLYYAYRGRLKANQRLRQIEQSRTDFFTKITHEFRTPLTVIRGFNELLWQKEDINDEQRNSYHQSIAQQGDNLLTLVNQLLDIAKLKSGGDRPDWRSGDIVPVINMLGETFALVARQRHLNFTYHCEVEAASVDFIPFYLERIITNLLSNAIKHTPEGGHITLTAIQPLRSNQIIIEVIDTGVGIAPDELEKIFELFYQSDNNAEQSGSGIGLSFVQLMIERMNGKITVQSTLGKSTTFTITFPVRNNALSNLQPLDPIVRPAINITDPTDKSDTIALKGEPTEQQDVTEIPTQQPIVLVVEDNPTVRQYISAILSERYEVHTANNGQEGLNEALTLIPDLIITDLMMPIMNGEELCSNIKQHALLNHIPMIMLTAKSSDDDRLEGLKAGADYYINKPFRSEELAFAISNLIERQERMKERYSQSINSTTGTYNADQTTSQTNQTTADTTDDSSTTAIEAVNIAFLNDLTRLINQSIKEPNLNVTFIAQNLCLSASQLNRKLKGLIGHTATSYILHCKIEHAKEILNDESVNISDVAYKCGFSDANYFSRVFKKETQMSPTDYRKQIG